MKTYKTVEVVTLSSGLLRLDADQAKTRQHLLEATEEKNIHRIIKPVQFKVGQSFGYDGPLDRVMGAAMFDVKADELASIQIDKDKNSAEKKARAEAKAAEKKAEADAKAVAKAAAEKKAEKESAAKKKAGNKDTVADLEDIAVAIAALDADDKNQWTKEGVPQVKAIEQVLGQDISSDGRDAGWAFYLEHIEVVEAIEALDPDNTEEWTEGGKPDVKAIEIVLERDITEGQRDLSWEFSQKIAAAE